jgi:hypothetical protein
LDRRLGGPQSRPGGCGEEKNVLLLHLEVTIRNQNHVHEEIKNRLNSRNSWYRSTLYVLSSRLLAKNINIKLHETVIISAFMCTKTVCFTPKEKHRLRTLENVVLKRIFESKGEDARAGWKELHIEDLHNLYLSDSVIKSG